MVTVVPNMVNVLKVNAVVNTAIVVPPMPTVVNDVNSDSVNVIPLKLLQRVVVVLTMVSVLLAYVVVDTAIVVIK